MALGNESRTEQLNKALWRSWLARRPVTAEVAGSSPVRVARDDRRIRFYRMRRLS